MIKLGLTKEEIMSNLQHELEGLKSPSETWLEVIADYCSSYDIEETDIKRYLSPVMIERIRDECEKLNLLKEKHQSLDIF